MPRTPIDQSRWQAWIDHVCAGVGVDARLVDARAIHDLTGVVAAIYERPMAPVAAHLAGMAHAAGRTPAEVDAALTAAARDAAGRTT